jgi:hypothetical protein
MFSSTSKKAAAALALAVMLMSVFVPAAFASSSAIYQNCKTGGSLDGFSKSELQSALGGVPADADQYYACSAQINAAIINKATKDIPGGGKGVKGTKDKLKKATVDDLTTPAERKKAAAKVERATKLDTSKPLSSSSDPAIATASGQTLSSSTAPSTPIALVIGVLGLALLAGADLAGRLGKMPGVSKRPPGSNQRDDS